MLITQIIRLGALPKLMLTVFILVAKEIGVIADPIVRLNLKWPFPTAL